MYLNKDLMKYEVSDYKNPILLLLFSHQRDFLIVDKKWKHTKMETCFGRDNLESNIELQLQMPVFNIWLGPDLTDEVMWG